MGHSTHFQPYLEGVKDWMPSFSQLVQSYFVIITTAGILAGTLPFFRNSILSYGKLDYPSTPEKEKTTPKKQKSLDKNVQDQSLVATIRSFRVPKSWFAHFYLLAPLWMIYLSLDLALYASYSSVLNVLPDIVVSTYPNWSFLTLLNILGVMPSASTCSSIWNPPPTVLLAMFCYLLQTIRRFYEAWFIQQSSPKATMHVGHYIVGITYYLAVAPAIWVDSYESWARSCKSETYNPPTGILHLFPLQAWIGLVIFIWGYIHQYNCHIILANLRKPTTGTAESQQSVYKVPHGDWFEYLVTPHYSAEMVIYFALYLITTATPLITSPNDTTHFLPTTLFIAIWVVIDLGIVALETDQWYRKRFGENYVEIGRQTSVGSSQIKKAPKRAILVPYIY